eukprot:gb/GFBE01015243.1/.p1 GENE.gb/GFBE01015243.1/~~gb/GFBE01015243.1/.p1  ORF type:complete len:227 (+),score=35.89 gb/GFBE01015243.1/:1-681(+)
MVDAKSKDLFNASNIPYSQSSGRQHQPSLVATSVAVANGHRIFRGQSNEVSPRGSPLGSPKVAAPSLSQGQGSADAKERWAQRRQKTFREYKDAPDKKHMLTLNRKKFPADNAFMGKVIRNPVTGEIRLRNVNPRNDFSIVDLFTRTRIEGSPTQLASDPYLFKSVVLPLRTWMYHDLYRSKKMVVSTDENSMVKYVLSCPAIDAEIKLATGHRWCATCQWCCSAS